MRLFILLISVILSTSLLNAQELANNCMEHVDGNVFNKKNNQTISNAIITLRTNGKIVKEIESDEAGHFSFDLNCNSRYQISAIYPNFTKNIKLVFTSKQGKKHQIKLELYPIEEFGVKNGKKVIIADSIDFIPDDYSLGEKAEKTLDKVFDLLEKYPFLKIEIGFHTDSRGDQKFLINLTQKRAEVCSNYLINKGIDPDRVIPKGYGATQLLNHCKPNVKCTNAEHLKNRRTEFVVLNDSKE